MEKSDVSAERPDSSTNLDRLARSTLHLHQIVNDVDQKGVGFKVLEQSIDTTTKKVRLLFTMRAAIAEFESGLRKERQMKGIAKAKERNVRFGAKPKLSSEQIEELRQKRAEGFLIKGLMRSYGISKARIYRHLKISSKH